MNKINFLLVLIFIFSGAYAQKIVKTEGEAQVPVTENISKADAKKQAQELATINALENAFGTVIVQGNATYMKNNTTGDKTETQTVFNTIANTTVKGEVLEVLDVKFDELKKGDQTDIRCKIKVKARELTEAQIDYQAYSLSGNTKNNESTKFYNGDDFYFYFKSPTSGYLSLFIDVNGTTERILPYQNMPVAYENGIPIEADKDYIFFSKSPEHNYFAKDNVQVDEIFMSIEGADQELWRLFVVFSKDPLNKPGLKDNPNKEKLSESEIKKRISVPKALPSEDFQRWKIQNQEMRKDLQIKILDVSVDAKKK